MKKVVSFVAALGAAGFLASAAWIALSGSSGVADRVIVEYGAVAGQSRPASEQIAPDSTAAPAVPISSGALATLQTEPGPNPVRIRVDAIDLDASIEPMGYDPERRQMEIPGRADLVAWYRHGPLPGESGSSVLAAHVDWNRRPGAFYRLSEVRAGDFIVIEFADGSTRRFAAVGLESFEKSVLPGNRLFAKDGPAVLTLITCGGEFDRSEGGYAENLVLQAVEVVPPPYSVSDMAG